MSLTNKTLELPKNVIGTGINSTSQLNTIKKFIELNEIKKNPMAAFIIAGAFEKKVLIDYALQAYQIALEIDPKMNFNFQMAVLYGQNGQTDQMIEMFLEESYINPQNLILIQNQFTRFMNENADVTFNEALRKALLIRIQKNQDVFWNQYLSWYYVQQKEFGKAFIQEKAIYKRNPESFDDIIQLAQICVNEKENETAQAIFQFILQNTADESTVLNAQYFLLKNDYLHHHHFEFLSLSSDCFLLKRHSNEHLNKSQLHLLKKELRRTLKLELLIIDY